MARLTAREIGRIESTYTSDLGQLTWAWVLKADGRVLYRLSHINGRPERNYWRQVYQFKRDRAPGDRDGRHQAR